MGGACFSEYTLKEWSYGNYFLHGSKTSLNECSEEKIMFIRGLEKFLDEKKFGGQNDSNLSFTNGQKWTKNTIRKWPDLKIMQVSL